MTPCICGHVHFATCRHCNCPENEPDDGTDGTKSYPGPDWTLDRYQGIYSPPGGYGL